MRRTVLAVLAGLGVFGAAEAFARFQLGLGTPPLYERHPTLEYRAVPNQSLSRFGNSFETNEYGMRSPALAGDPRPLVLVVGDSVPFGGDQLDQRDLATSRLSTATLLVANFSAGSWGPENERLALDLVTEAGLAPRAIVVVLNSDDLVDIPDYGAELSPSTHPTRAPVLALEEAVLRYLPRYLPRSWSGRVPASDGAVPTQGPAPERLAEGRRLYRGLLEQLATGPVLACLVLHPRLSELRAAHTPVLDEMDETARGLGLAVVAAAPIYRGQNGAELAALYLDDIHLTVAGQERLAAAIETCIDETGVTL